MFRWEVADMVGRGIGKDDTKRKKNRNQGQISVYSRKTLYLYRMCTDTRNDCKENT